MNVGFKRGAFQDQEGLKYMMSEVRGAEAEKCKDFEFLSVFDISDLNYDNLIQKAADSSSRKLQRIEEETLSQRMEQEIAEFQRDACMMVQSVCKKLEKGPKYMTGKVSRAQTSTTKCKGFEIRPVVDILILKAADSGGKVLQRIQNESAGDQTQSLDEEGEMQTLRAVEEIINPKCKGFRIQSVVDIIDNDENLILMAEDSNSEELERIQSECAGDQAQSLHEDRGMQILRAEEKTINPKCKGFKILSVVDVIESNDNNNDNLILMADDSSGIHEHTEQRQCLHEDRGVRTLRAEEETFRWRVAQEVRDIQRDTCKKESLRKEVEELKTALSISLKAALSITLKSKDELHAVQEENNRLVEELQKNCRGSSAVSHQELCRQQVELNQQIQDLMADKETQIVTSKEELPGDLPVENEGNVSLNPKPEGLTVSEQEERTENESANEQAESNEERENLKVADSSSEELQRIQALHQELLTRCETAEAKAEFFQLRLESEMKSHQDELNQNQLLIQALRAEEETFRQRMAQEVADIQRDTCIKEESLRKEMEELKTALSISLKAALSMSLKSLDGLHMVQNENTPCRRTVVPHGFTLRSHQAAEGAEPDG